MKVLGFTVIKKDGYYKAYKKIKGKMKWVYIGKTSDKAKEKILSYCIKNSIAIQSKQREKISHEILEDLPKDTKTTEKISLDSQKIVKILYRLSIQEKKIVSLQKKVQDLQEQIDDLKNNMSL